MLRNCGSTCRATVDGDVTMSGFAYRQVLAENRRLRTELLHANAVIERYKLALQRMPVEAESDDTAIQSLIACVDIAEAALVKTKVES